MQLAAPNIKMAPIGLGTVQFGVDYGIGNVDGRTQPGEVSQILETARAHGIRMLDTAAQYGDSEAVLGDVLAGDEGFDIITKTPPLDAGVPPADWLRQSLQTSLRLLQRRRLYGLMLHRCDDLLSEQGHELYETLRRIKAEGLVKKIGVSVYNPRQLDYVLEHFAVDLVQLPLNLLDQRMIAGGQLARLRAAGIEVHARSVFLQGLLLMKPKAAPDHFAPVRAHLQRLHDACAEIHLSPHAAALNFVRTTEGINCAIVGVCSTEQLNELLAARIDAEQGLPEPEAHALQDERVINPSQWPAHR